MMREARRFHGHLSRQSAAQADAVHAHSFERQGGDHVQDDAFLSGSRNNEYGGEYGPYQITRFSTGQPKEICDLHYTMSTWNPYQSVLMRTRIRESDLGLS
jgi:hypothetical protein